jgi:hypothetical protein
MNADMVHIPFESMQGRPVCGIGDRKARGRQDAEINHAARDETLRLDGARSLGENLEQADALIRAAFELAHGFAAANP